MAETSFLFLFIRIASKGRADQKVWLRTAQARQQYNTQ